MATKKPPEPYPTHLLPGEIEQLKQLLSKHSSPVLVKWIKERIEYKEGLLRKKFNFGFE
jgi:hypothetical protein